MFAIVSHKMKLQNGTVQINHNIHMLSEVELTIAKLDRDSRVSDLAVTSSHKTLEAARSAQAVLRKQAEFIQYFIDFYGPNGLYPIAGLELSQIEYAIKLRGSNFEGDSFDRESIRDAIKCALNQKGGVFELP